MIIKVVLLYTVFFCFVFFFLNRAVFLEYEAKFFSKFINELRTMSALARKNSSRPRASIMQLYVISFLGLFLPLLICLTEITINNKRQLLTMKESFCILYFLRKKKKKKEQMKPKIYEQPV